MRLEWDVKWAWHITGTNAHRHHQWLSKAGLIQMVIGGYVLLASSHSQATNTRDIRAWEWDCNGKGGVSLGMRQKLETESLGMRPGTGAIVSRVCPLSSSCGSSGGLGGSLLKHLSEVFRDYFGDYSCVSNVNIQHR